MAWWTAVVTLDTMMRLWPVAAVWLILLVITTVPLARQGRASGRNAAWALLPFAFSTAIILCGVLFYNPARSSPRIMVSLAGALIWVLLIGQLVASVLLIRRLRGARMFATVVSLGGLWLSLVGGLVSLMSVSGDWL